MTSRAFYLTPRDAARIKRVISRVERGEASATSRSFGRDVLPTLAFADESIAPNESGLVTFAATAFDAPVRGTRQVTCWNLSADTLTEDSDAFQIEWFSLENGGGAWVHYCCGGTAALNLDALCLDPITPVDETVVTQVRKNNMLRLVEDQDGQGALDFDPGPIEDAVLNAIGPPDDNGEMSLVWTNTPKLRSLELCEGMRIACDASTTTVDSDQVAIDDDTVIADANWAQGYTFRAPTIQPPSLYPVDSLDIPVDSDTLPVDLSGPTAGGEYDPPYIDEQYLYGPPVPARPGGIMYAAGVWLGTRERHVQIDFLPPGLSGTLTMPDGGTLTFVHGVLVGQNAVASFALAYSYWQPTPDQACVCPDPEVYAPCEMPSTDVCSYDDLCTFTSPGFVYGAGFFLDINRRISHGNPNGQLYRPETISQRQRITFVNPGFRLTRGAELRLIPLTLAGSCSPSQTSFIQFVIGERVNPGGGDGIGAELLSQKNGVITMYENPDITYVAGAEMEIRATHLAADQYHLEFLYNGAVIHDEPSVEILWFDPFYHEAFIDSAVNGDELADYAIELTPCL
jgi:hypothetical protein